MLYEVKRMKSGRLAWVRVSNGRFVQYHKKGDNPLTVGV